jgi:hypothetical protein
VYLLNSGWRKHKLRRIGSVGSVMMVMGKTLLSEVFVMAKNFNIWQYKQSKRFAANVELLISSGVKANKIPASDVTRWRISTTSH